MRTAHLPFVCVCIYVFILILFPHTRIIQPFHPTLRVYMLLKLLMRFLLNNFFLNLGSAGIASFNPRQKGEYKVCVMRNEKHIKNSPFRLQIGDKELGHAAGCKVSGAIDKSIANHPNTVEIDTTNAGKFSCYLAVSFCHWGTSAGL